MSGRENQPIEVLLVEDNPGDARLTKEALTEWDILNNLHVVEDGQKGLAFLRRQEPYEDAPRPDLIILDLNLPKITGRDLLEAIKEDGDLLTIPVVVLTTSQSDRDIRQAYDLHANCYITKPVDLDRFMEVIKSFGTFWFSTVTLPRGEQNGL